MNKHSIHFRDSLDLSVDIYTAENTALGKGNLVFSPDKILILKVESPKIVQATLSKKKIVKLVKCQGQSSSQKYSLFDCNINDEYIYPKLLIQGDVSDLKFKEIDIVLHGVSEWIDESHGFEISDTEIKKTISQDKFNIKISDGHGRKFSIFNTNNTQIDKQEGNNRLIKEYTTITYKAEKQLFSIDDIQNKANEAKQIFSLLLGYSIDVEYIWIKPSKGILRPAYFSNVSQSNYPYRITRGCITDANYLFRHDKWKIIFEGYYGKKENNFQTLWPRMVGMFSYNGFWEYQILAYVSLIDRYCDLYVEDKQIKLPDRQFRALRRKLKSELEANKSPGQGNNDVVINSFINQLNGIRNTNLGSFRERFEFALSEMSTEIKDAINISRDEFQYLKNLRDQVAHGESPRTKDRYDISHEMQLKDKLIILLLYWVYRDFGFSDLEFIKFIRGNFHPAILNAKLNRAAIDKACGDVLFIDVNKSTLNKIKKTKRLDTVLEYRENTNKYYFEAEYSMKTISEWLFNRKRPFNSIEDYLDSIVDKERIKNIGYVSQAYVQYKEEACQVSGLCILNCSDAMKLKMHRVKEIEHRKTDC